MASAAFAFLERIRGLVASNAVAELAEPGAAKSDPLADVIAGCRRLDPLAQRELVLRTQDRVYRLLVRLVGAQDAEDVAQQVYLQVFRKLDLFRGQSSFSTWLHRVTINEALQHLRGQRRKRCAVLSWEVEEQRQDGRMQCETRELLDHALASIEPELRTVFVLREVEGLSYDAIAAAVEIPPGTVASRLSRARHELQERLRALGWKG